MKGLTPQVMKAHKTGHKQDLYEHAYFMYVHIHWHTQFGVQENIYRQQTGKHVNNRVYLIDKYFSSIWNKTINRRSCRRIMAIIAYDDASSTESDSQGRFAGSNDV